MKIEIWSDVMCPFCYIGKNNFEKALEQLPFKDEVEVEWKSFQLDPSLNPEETKSTVDYFREKKGFPEAQARQMISQVQQMGTGAGINFHFEKALITNTFSAHKILHLAKKYKKTNEMEEALFIAHFIEGKNVGDHKTLIDLAESLGIDSEETRQVLDTSTFDDEIKQDIQEARANGVSGVPFFILNGKYSVSGAQPAELFTSALQQTYDETMAPLKIQADNGASCDADGCEI
ncbi:DsbA family oxidoreductase [uncultured Chryseobacterium sp.]|uniref:DsbA family oxidoreductase n=2 Tax=uncultured Chryseobacterium sp. TaxID=259322 RepID=UPI0025EBC59B|nr:DsbA family oxidoreductase [uncultured Chryseobacterium sp.]